MQVAASSENDHTRSYQTRGGKVMPDLSAYPLVFFQAVCTQNKPGNQSNKNDTIYVRMSKIQTCKGNFCTSTYHVSGLISTAKDGHFIEEIPERMHQEWLSLTT